jgi:hypothetical protein
MFINSRGETQASNTFRALEKKILRARRGRAQGGTGTIQATLAGVGVCGDADFVLWDSSVTEKGGRAQDLAGRRLPVLLDMGKGAGHSE